MTAPLASLVTTAIPARGGPTEVAGILRAQGAASFIAVRRPADGALGRVRTALHAHVCVLRLAAKARQAGAVVALARLSRAQADTQTVAAMATGIGVPHVGEPTTATSPQIRQATGATDGPAPAVPMERATTNGAPAEEALPQILAAELPKVPPASVPIGPRRAR